MADIVYTYRGKVYLNITNRCPCRCTFCIRSNGDGLGSAHTLWHKSDPTAEEIAKATNSEVVQVIGSKFVLYRRNDKEPKIVLPKASKKK